MATIRLVWVCCLGLTAVLLPLGTHPQTFELNGSFTQGGLLVGRIDVGGAVFVDDVGLPVSPDGIFLIGFDRDAPPRVDLRLKWPTGVTETRILEIAPRRYDVQHIDGLPAAQVTPPAALRARIQEEAALIRTARAQRDDARQDFLAGFDWPASGPVSGVYGSQRVLNGQPRRPHYGLDIAAPQGAPVRAPAAGLVTLAQSAFYYSGGTLIVDHGGGLSSTFLHLSKIEVREGQRVEKGTLIGAVGATGRATGAHLDWRINLGDIRLDPALLLPPGPPEVSTLPH